MHTQNGARHRPRFFATHSHFMGTLAQQNRIRKIHCLHTIMHPAVANTFLCKHCQAYLTYSQPIKLNTLVRIMTAFIQDHRTCRPPKTTDKKSSN